MCLLRIYSKILSRTCYKKFPKIAYQLTTLYVYSILILWMIEKEVNDTFSEQLKKKEEILKYRLSDIFP